MKLAQLIDPVDEPSLVTTEELAKQYTAAHPGWTWRAVEDSEYLPGERRPIATLEGSE